MYSKDFPDRLKEARKLSGLTQQEVSTAIGITRTLLSRYENGKLEPNLDTLGTLSEFYNVTTDWLLGIGRRNDNDTHQKQIKEIKERNNILKETENQAKKTQHAI